jgi:REP element-mobilizing transposase RayT
VTKYRYKILRGDVAERARDLLRQICMAREVTIIRGAVSPDHIHMLIAAPPQLSPSKLVQFFEGSVVAPATAGVPRVAETVLGTTSAGAGLLLCERRRGR